jgi:hypothetical protein
MSRERSRFMLLYVLIPVIVGLALAATTVVIWKMSWLFPLSASQTVAIAIVVAILPFVGACALAVKYVRVRDSLQDWMISRFAVWVGAKATVIFLLAIVAAFQGWIWDELKSLLGLKF